MRGSMLSKVAIGAALAVFLAASAAAQIVPGAEPAPGPAAPALGGGIKSGIPQDGGVQPESQLDTEFKAFLVGRWRAPLPAPQGWTSFSDVTYAPDGTFTGSVINASPYGTSQTPVRGTWTLMAIDQSNFNLTLSFKTPVSPDGSDTLTMIDQNTLYSAGLKENVTRSP